MLPTDDERAARRSAKSIADPRASHFYDPARRVGVAFAEDHFHPLMREALAVLPNDSPYRERLVKQIDAPKIGRAHV